MKINKEMAQHLLRYHLEYETTKSNNADIRNIFVLLKYFMDEIESFVNFLVYIQDKNVMLNSPKTRSFSTTSGDYCGLADVEAVCKSFFLVYT